MPGAHDALSARIVEMTGFKAFTVGGYSASATLLGRPDVSLLCLTEMVDHIARLADAVEIPMLADGDTGHGNVVNVMRTVKEMERAGAAGLFIEDQLFPKRCGHMEGKQVIPPSEMVAKIKAAVDTRTDPDFVIMARTDSLAIYGLGDAVERGNLYREAGADIIFVEAPRNVDEMRAITRGVKAPNLANNIEGGRTPLLSAKELEEIGYSAVIFPVAATYAVSRAVKELMGEIYREGTSRGFFDRMTLFKEFNELIGLPRIREAERKYYSRDGPAAQQTPENPQGESLSGAGSPPYPHPDITQN